MAYALTHEQIGNVRVIRLDPQDVEQGYVDITFNLLDKLVDDDIDEVVFIAPNGRYTTTVEEWQDGEDMKQKGGRAEGAWIKRMHLSRMTRA
jgi:hypothetical protein